MDDKELLKLSDRLRPFAQGILEKDHMDMIYLMLTDILHESSYMLCVGEDSVELLEQAFDAKAEGDTVYLQGVVSRKKQLVPRLMATVQQEG